MAEELEDKEFPTPTELLIKVMEAFGEKEPQKAVVIWTTGDCIAWDASSSAVDLIGMMETVKHLLIRDKFIEGRTDG